ncbi:hypothetical protein Misp01_41520, partial [Microtetraspora sp. NBRC 13810]|uniref:ATP-binding cassette domain-containing protein n=1 Tax=Microtetraspora sp. NBRC 13810 TaxID=3030990 RepID=UPI002557AC0B
TTAEDVNAETPEKAEAEVIETTAEDVNAETPEKAEAEVIETTVEQPGTENSEKAEDAERTSEETETADADAESSETPEKADAEETETTPEQTASEDTPPETEEKAEEKAEESTAPDTVQDAEKAQEDTEAGADKAAEDTADAVVEATEETPEKAEDTPEKTDATEDTPEKAEDTPEKAESAEEASEEVSEEGVAGEGAAVVVGGPAEGEVRLRIADAHATSSDGRPLLRGLSLEVRAGEILGIAGVEGNGQAAIGDLLSSLLDLDRGAVEVCGSAVRAGRPGAMHAAGVGVVPEDRHVSGCVLDMSVAENLVMADLGDVSASGFLSPRRMRERAERLIEEFDISVPTPDTPMRLLSGGNQQKVVLARELAAGPKVLVVAQPTRGLDVGAIEYMTERIYEAARSGIAVLLISTELEEILTLAHRVAVIHRGAIVGEMDRAEVDLERLGLMMGGQAA